MSEIVKVCKKHGGLTREQVYFIKNNKKVCKFCRKEYSQKWYAANPDNARERSRKWCASNRDKVNEIKRKWRAANPDKVKEDRLKRYIANREKIIGFSRKWAAANPDKVNEASRKRYAANPEKLRERQRKWKENNYDKVREKNRKHGRKCIKNLSDSYVKKVIKDQSFSNYIPPGEIESKRLSLIAHRLYREAKREGKA